MHHRALASLGTRFPGQLAMNYRWRATLCLPIWLTSKHLTKIHCNIHSLHHPMGHIIGGLVRVRLVDQQRVGRHLTYLPLSGDWEIDGGCRSLYTMIKWNRATCTSKH